MKKCPVCGGELHWCFPLAYHCDNCGFRASGILDTEEVNRILEEV